MNDETGEKIIPYTFFDDVKTNRMIVQLSYEIVGQQQQIMDKFDFLVIAWTKRWRLKGLFDKNEMTKLQKQIDKSQSTREIEKKILNFKVVRDQTVKNSSEQHNYIVLIDNSDLYQKTIDKIDEWLQILGDSLKSIATKELRQIVEQTIKYNKDLNAEMGSIEQLKVLLKVISEIKDMSMDMEFRIVEVQEQFRVLKMYEYESDEDIQNEVDTPDEQLGRASGVRR